MSELTNTQLEAVNLCHDLDLPRIARHLEDQWRAGRRGYIDYRVIRRGADYKRLVRLVKQGNREARCG